MHQARLRERHVCSALLPVLLVTLVGRVLLYIALATLLGKIALSVGGLAIDDSNVGL